MTAGGCQVAGTASGRAGCEHYLEDFAVGQTFSSGRLRIEGERMLAFAAEFASNEIQNALPTQTRE